MYVKFLFLISFLGVSIYSTVKIVQSMNQKTDNLYAWMIWKTSKEYSITYHPNEYFSELDLEAQVADIIINGNSVSVDDKSYAYQSNENRILVGCTTINLCHDITLAVETLDGPKYYICHYRASVHPALFLTQKLIELPELNKYYSGSVCAESYSANKDGDVVVTVVPDGTIAKIVPKKIPSKNLLTCNNVYDVMFNYFYNKKHSL